MSRFSSQLTRLLESVLEVLLYWNIEYDLPNGILHWSDVGPMALSRQDYVLEFPALLAWRLGFKVLWNVLYCLRLGDISCQSMWGHKPQ